MFHRDRQAIFPAGQFFHDEATASIGEDAHAVDCGVDALNGSKAGLRVFAFELQVDSDGVPIKLRTRSSREIEHDQLSFDG